MHQLRDWSKSQPATTVSACPSTREEVTANLNVLESLLRNFDPDAAQKAMEFLPAVNVAAETKERLIKEADSFDFDSALETLDELRALMRD